MAKVLTELDEFTAPVTVPEGTDSRDNAADVVEAFVQALANRTKYLNLHAAIKELSNTFLQPLVVDQNDAPDSPLLSTTKLPTDHTPDPTNKWQMLFAIPNTAGYDTRFFAGGDDVAGLFAITVNARWHVPTQLWRQLDAGEFSYALILQDGELRWSRQAIGASPWSVWPTTTGDLIVGGGLAASTAGVTGDISIGGEYRLDFPTGRVRSSTLVPLSGVSAGPLRDDATGYVGTGHSYFFTTFGLRLPVNATFAAATIEVMVLQTTTTPAEVNLIKMGGTVWTPGSLVAPTRSVVDTDVGPGATGLAVLSVAVGVFDASAEYQLEFRGGDPADVVVAARVANWRDGGPLNNF